MPRRKKPPEVLKFEQRVGKYVGSKLREWRKRSRMSLYDVAKMTGIAVSTISEYERGKYPCPIDRVRKFAKLYNAPLSEFHLEESSLEGDAKQIADLISEWPEDERSKILAAVLSHIANIKELRPPQK